MFFSCFPPALVLIVMCQLYLFCFEIIVAHSNDVIYVFPFLLLGVSVVNSWISKMVYFGCECSTILTHTKQIVEVCTHNANWVTKQSYRKAFHGYLVEWVKRQQN